MFEIQEEVEAETQPPQKALKKDIEAICKYMALSKPVEVLPMVLSSMEADTCTS